MATSQMSEVLQHLRRALVLRDATGLTDGQLLEDYISRRDEAALAALVRRHGPMVWGVCRRVLANFHDAEDAFQATFLVLVRRAASIASKELLANWLYGVAHQTARKARATAAKRRGRERQVTEMPEPVVTEQDLWRDLQPLLDQELSRLPDNYRAVIVLCDLEGKTRKEAAQQLGVPAGTVASRLATARTMLAKRLARHGLAVSGGALGAVLAPNATSAGVPTAVVSATIKVASLFAAGHAAATGAIPVKVIVLAEGVLKTMLLTKLKTTLLVLLVAVVAVGSGGLLYPTQAAERGQPRANEKPQAPKTEAADREKQSNGDMDRLQGTWRLVASEGDGVRLTEGRPEIKDTRLLIDQLSVTMTGKLIHSPNTKKEPEDVKAVGTFTLDTKKMPKQIAFIWETNPWLSKDYRVQRGIYALDGDRLKVCFYFPGEDTKLLVPTEFSANAGSKRSVATWKRVPAPAKGGTGTEAAGKEKQAKAEVEQAKVKVEMAKADADQAKARLEQAKSQVALAKARARQAEISAEWAQKSRTLAEAVSRAKAELAKAEAEQAKAKLAVAESDLEHARAEAEEAKAEIAVAKARLNYLTECLKAGQNRKP